MPVQVTYAIDSLDPNPTVDWFDTMAEAQEWVAEEVSRRVEWIVSHSPYPISDEELSELEETEFSLVAIVTV